MVNWIPIRLKTDKANFNAVRNKIVGYPEEVFARVLEPQLVELGEGALELMREIVRTSVTPTGEERATRGGQPGRIDTGKLINGLRSRVRMGEGKAQRFSMFVGWIDGKPGYAIFQEHGVQGGVKGMEATFAAQDFLLAGLQDIAKGRYTASTLGFNNGEGDGN